MSEPASAASAALSSAEDVRRVSQEVLSRSYYKLEEGSRLDSGSFLAGLWDALANFLGRIFRFLGSLWDMSPVLAILVMIGLTIVLVLLIVHIVWTLKRVVRDGRRPESDGSSQPPEWGDPGGWEARARAAAAAGRHVEAVRHLLRAAFIRLERFHKKRLQLGTTNREYLRKFGVGAMAEPLGVLVETIDRKWYGLGICDGSDYGACSRAYENIRLSLEKR